MVVVIGQLTQQLALGLAVFEQDRHVGRAAEDTNA